MSDPSVSAGRNALQRAQSLTLFAAVTVGLIAATAWFTGDRISANRSAHEARQLLAVLPADAASGQLLQRALPVPDPLDLHLAADAHLHLAASNGRVTALATPVVAPDGYSGRIELLVGLRRDGSISGVRVLDHRETPGLGDAIERRKSAWVEDFVGRSLANTSAEAWAVQPDGGDFDAFTGATITPRAVVKAVHGSLLWYENHRQQVLAAGDARVQETDHD